MESYTRALTDSQRAAILRLLGISSFPASPGDCLLAILNKAAEMGGGPMVGMYIHPKTGSLVGQCSLNCVGTLTADTPLDAALLAFAQLEPPHDR
jgi:hypothetical protein